MKMPRFATGFASAMCLLVILTGSSSALYLRPSLSTSYPTEPNNSYSKEFENVRSPEVTAKKLLIDFLGHSNSQTVDRTKRQIITEDIVLLIDGSGSVGSCEFNKGKEALMHMMKTLDFPGYDVKYAAVTFGSTATVNFKFLSNSMAAREITKISFPSGSTNTEAGLAEAKRLFDDPLSGRRTSAWKKVILFTDGDLTIPSAGANALKASGVDIYVIAFGSYSNRINEMVHVASSPPERYLFRVESYLSLWKVVQLAIKQVKPGKYSIVNYTPPC